MLKPNLERCGRWLRGAAGMGLLIGSVFLWNISRTAVFVMLVSAGFLLFEASRGWCVLRACGIKTKW